MQERTYLYLEPYTNVFYGREKALIYNTIDGNRIVVTDKKLIEILLQLTDDKNLYSVLLDDEQLSDSIVKGFIKSLQDIFMGDTVRESLVKTKPHQLTPILNFQKDLDRFKEDLYTSIGDNVMTYIFDLSIYINGNSNHKLSNAYKQFVFPDNSDRENISVGLVKKMVKELESNTYGNINIIGGDISTHPEINEIFDCLSELKMRKTVHVYYKDRFVDIADKENFGVKYYIDFPINGNIDFNELKSKGVGFSFIVQSEKDVEEAERIIEEYLLDDYEYRPYYNGHNLDFFEKNVYLNEEDILEVKPNQNDIFSNMKINKNNFGKLVVMSDGEVYANLNKNSLGNINNQTFHRLIFNELRGEKSWKDVRCKSDTCKECIYNCLCPSMSNYEYVIGKNNLCNVDSKN